MSEAWQSALRRWLDAGARRVVLRADYLNSFAAGLFSLYFAE
jgi:hypothetical protein